MKIIAEKARIDAIADAVRQKLNVETQYRLSEIPAAIDNIYVGGELEPLSATENGDYTPGTGIEGFSRVHVAVPVPTLVTKNIVSNGTYNASSDNANGYSSVVVNVPGGVTVEPLSVDQNGTYNPPSGVDGYAPVTVNVSGGGGSNITYGTDDPAASQGNDGDVYFKYEVFSGYNSLLPSEDANLNNWLKNTAAFPSFDNTYNIGENTLIHTGGNGYERIYVPITITQNTDYVFGLKYYSPSGVASGYGGQLAFGISYASESTMHSDKAISLTSKTNLSLTADSSYSDYSSNFNSGSNTDVYLVIDLNIYDDQQCTLKFKDIVFYKVGEPPVAVDGKVIKKAYLKQSGAWVDAIGAIID